MPSRTRWTLPFSADIRSLAALRVGLGLCLLGDLSTRAGSSRAFYTDFGVLPRSPLEHGVESSPHFGLYFLSGEVWWPHLLFGVTAILATLFMLGMFTRLCNVLLWFLLGSLHMRNGTVLQGGDSILLIALFWSVFLPLEAAWSVDAAARPRENQARLVLNWGSVALVLQLFIIYVVSGVLKSRMGYWQRGEGVYNALSADHFVTPFGEWLYQFEDLLVGMNHGTLVLEMCAPLLLFVPFAFGPVRTALVVLFMGFHAGLGLSIDLGLFPWVSAAVWLFALPSWFWDQLDRRLGATRLANWVARLAVCAEAPVAALVRLRATANRPFVAIATLATRLSWSRLVQLFGAASLAYVSMLALGEVESDFAPKGALAKPKSWFRISQGWRMFVPPYRDAGWFVAVGTRADGKTVEVLFGSGKEVTWERPRYVAAMFPDQRWRKYLVNLRKARFARHRKRLAGYLCRDWNETHAGESAIESVELVYLKRTIKLHGKRGQVQRDSWTRQRCRDG